MRIMAVDYGKNRVGIALTDPLRVIAQPFLTLKVKSHKELIKRLKFIIEENDVGLVLVGNPISHTGATTEMSQEIHDFVKKLEKSITIEVKLWDERFTSRYAANILKQTGLGKQKEKIDQVAAAIILDEYLKSVSECSA